MVLTAPAFPTGYRVNNKRAVGGLLIELQKKYEAKQQG